MTSDVEARLAQHGIVLPDPVMPLGAYRSVVVSGTQALFAGHGPIDAAHRPLYQGRVGADLTIEEGIEAARVTALNVLATAAREFGSLDVIARVLRVTGYILAPADFTEHPRVLNGCSELFHLAFGVERGSHARTAIGIFSSVHSLAVTIDVVMELSEVPESLVRRDPTM